MMKEMIRRFIEADPKHEQIIKGFRSNIDAGLLGRFGRISEAVTPPLNNTHEQIRAIALLLQVREDVEEALAGPIEQKKEPTPQTNVEYKAPTKKRGRPPKKGGGK